MDLLACSLLRDREVVGVELDTRLCGILLTRSQRRIGARARTVCREADSQPALCTGQRDNLLVTRALALEQGVNEVGIRLQFRRRDNRGGRGSRALRE